MRDIFDIINKARTKNIKMKGVVSDYSLLTFTVETFNAFLDIVLEHRNEIDTITFEVKSEVDDEKYATLGNDPFRDWFRPKKTKRTITFDIDICMCNSLYETIYDEFEDMIDYFTPGSVVYDHHIDEEITITRNAFDADGDYGIYINTNDWDTLVHRDVQTIRIPEDIDFVPLFSDEERPVLGRGLSESLTMPFDITTITDVSNMFTNCRNLTIDEIEHIVNMQRNSLDLRLFGQGDRI